MSPDGQRALARYVDRGWFDAAGDARLRDDDSRSLLPRPAYLVIASSGMWIPPLSEVQVTTRINYRAFRGRRLVVASDATRRFDLLDLKVLHRSQFRRAEDLPLRTCVGESAPELIQWPLEVCGASGDIVIRAIIPRREAGGEEDLGVDFEMILIGEVS
jgi:hypothetical protein